MIVKVEYYWTEDGDPEVCSVEKITASKHTKCYHRNCDIQKGEEVYKLTAPDDDIYIICKKCYAESTVDNQK